MQNLRAALLTLLLPLLPIAAAAHDLHLTETLVILRGDGSYQIDVTCDLDALALGASPSEDSAALAATLRALPPQELERRLESLRRLLERRLRVRFDGKAATPRISFPGNVGDAGSAPPSHLGTLARLTGAIPAGAQSFTFFASRAFPPVELTILEQRTLSGVRESLEKGEESTPYRLGRGFSK